MTTPLDDGDVMKKSSWKVNEAQSKGLYQTLKSAHDKYVSKPSGSAAGRPPPDMFEGFWDQYSRSFRQCANLNPAFQYSPLSAQVQSLKKNECANSSSLEVSVESELDFTLSQSILDEAEKLDDD
jgi:hypothetical protein